jgi:HSP20 family protein
MTEMKRWNPMDEFRTMRRMFRQPTWAIETPMFKEVFDLGDGMDLNIYEDREAMKVKAALPGVERGDIHVDITDNVLNIQVDRRDEEEVREENYYLKEWHTGKISRSLRLPANLKTDKVLAEFKNGCLTLTIPKTKGLKPSAIEVKVG